MKSRAVFISPAARNDLLELYDWIAPRGGPQAAFNYVGRLEAFCRNLGTASERGYRRDDVRHCLRIVGFERRVTIAFVVTDADGYYSESVFRREKLGRDAEMSAE